RRWTPIPHRVRWRSRSPEARRARTMRRTSWAPGSCRCALVRHNHGMPSWPAQLKIHRRRRPALELGDARGHSPAALREFCLRDPVGAALLGEHVEALGQFSFYGDQMWCLADQGELTGMCWTGGNVVPFRLGTLGT